MFRPPRPVGMTLNLAPMVDVMMCLIIFFLLASELVNAERFPVALPWAIAAKEVDRSQLGERVVINVRQKQGGKPDEAEYVVVDWDGQKITERVLAPDDVAALLKTRAARAGGAAGEKKSLKCVIRADKDAQYQHVEVVLRGCGLADISDVVFATNAGVEEGGA